MASYPKQDSHVWLGLGLPHFLSICSVPSSMPGFTAGADRCHQAGSSGLAHPSAPATVSSPELRSNPIPPARLLLFPGSSVGGLQFRRPQFSSWVRKSPWRRDRLPTPVFLGFPDGSDGKESACNAGDLGLKNLLEKGTSTHSSILVWRSHMERSLAGYSPWDCKKSDMTEQLSLPPRRVVVKFPRAPSRCFSRPISWSVMT